MFSKISRYRKQPDIVTIDNKGRVLASRDLRLLPEVSGTFLHTVEEVDRLDHLAYKYYKQPRKWWRICDANPEFMSPQALLGKEPIVSERFSLTFNVSGAQPPWADLLRRFSETLGVECVKIVDDIRPVPEEQTINGQLVTVYVEHFERAVIVKYNRMNLSAENLASIITDTGFEVSQPENIGRIGKKIIIPPDVVA